MRAVTVTDIDGVLTLVVAEHDEPVVGPDDVLVSVKAISLNNGEVRGALHQGAVGDRPGWDLAGVVEAAAGHTGFAVGDRVVGFVFEGGWAERVSVPAQYLTTIPDDIGFEAAATLPIAGLTAAVGLTKKSLRSGQRLLVTGATGGVGVFAIQLGAALGLHVTALTRDPGSVDRLRQLGATEVAIGSDAAGAAEPYDLILEGVGGALLGDALLWLAPRGMCVQLGDAAGAELTTFDARRFRLGPGGLYGGTSLYGFFLLEELTRPDPVPAAPLLADLVGRLADGSLDPSIGRTASWRDVDAVAHSLLAREFLGKAVLRID